MTDISGRLHLPNLKSTALRNEGEFVAESKELKPLDVIAKEVIAGKWGKGSECRERLEKAGYNYNDVFRWVGYLKR